MISALDLILMLIFRIDLLTITDGPEEDKKTVVLSARVHPGESCASYMMEGFLDFLTG